MRQCTYPFPVTRSLIQLTQTITTSPSPLDSQESKHYKNRIRDNPRPVEATISLIKTVSIFIIEASFSHHALFLLSPALNLSHDRIRLCCAIEMAVAARLLSFSAPLQVTNKKLLFLTGQLCHRQYQLLLSNLHLTLLETCSYISIAHLDLSGRASVVTSFQFKSLRQSIPS